MTKIGNSKLWLNLYRLIVVIIITFSLFYITIAQTSSTDGHTPLYLAPGAPLGSYSLSEFEQVNLFNGNLNFHLPLLNIKSRGDLSYTMGLTIEQKWRVDDEGETPPGHPRFLVPNDFWWTPLERGYGPGILLGRSTGYGEWSYERHCEYSSDQIFANTLTRLTFTTQDGTEIELRDKLTNGRPMRVDEVPCGSLGNSRGKIFVSADGSSTTFISDSQISDHILKAPSPNVFAPSGVLFFKNGTQYRIDNGNVTWIRDRNGNKLTFLYGSKGRVVSITDSLNRKTAITYDDVSNQDTISYKGANGEQRIVKVYYTRLNSLLRPGDSISTYKQLFPELNASPDSEFNPFKVSKVELSNQQLYEFLYNKFGELAIVKLPSGGKYEYVWGSGFPGTQPDHSGASGDKIYRLVKSRLVYKDSTTLESQVFYNRNYAENNSIQIVSVENKDSNDRLLTKSDHSYYLGLEPGFPGYPGWKTGREFKTEIYEVVNDVNILRKRISNTWMQREPVSWWPVIPSDSPDSAPPNDPRIIESATTLSESNQTAKTVFGYDIYNNQTDVWEYDYGIGGSGNLLRHTHSDYLKAGYDVVAGTTENPDLLSTIHIRNLPAQQIVFDGSDVAVARIVYEYDNYSSDSGRTPLTDRPNISGLDNSSTVNYKTRGNVTAISRWLDNPSGYITTFQQYDIAGNIVKTIDGRGIATTLDYSDRFGSPDSEARGNIGSTELGGQISYAFPTKVTNALGHEAYTQYDYYLGKAVNVEDANGIVSNTSYNDLLDRPTQSIRAVNDSLNKSQAAVTYDNTNRIITTTSDLNVYGDNKLKSQSLYDGLGRTIESRSYENVTNYIISKTEYDALGRPYRVTNPHRSGETEIWTTSSYDSLGRIVGVATQDGARVTTQYYGNQITVTDQAGKTRRSEIDALGRLIKVTENPGGLNYETFYSYDVLGNLVKVVQAAQSRWFAYDSLSRLIRVRNPEQDANHNLPPYTDPVTGGSGWSIAYSYDANGNLLEKTDARSVKMTMSYDELNRVKLKGYSDSTQPVNYYYDNYPAGAPNLSGISSKGRLLAITYGPGTDGTYYKYDLLGRIVTNHQRTGAANNATTYEYNLSGNLVTETRSNGRIVNPSYDEIGRLNALNTSIPNAPTANLLNNLSYTSFGAIQSEKYGNGLLHSFEYNTRMQPTNIRLGVPANHESHLRLGYLYGTANNPTDTDYQIAANQNNGNIGRINYVINGTLYNSQTFQYDQLNRLQYGIEHKNGILNDANRAWDQTFGYDRYGNKQLVTLTGGGSEQWVDQVWFDDSLPQGAIPAADGGDSWNWISSGPAPKSGNVSHQSNIANPLDYSPPPAFGNVSHQSNIAQGVHQHYYWASTEKPYVRAGYKLYAYVYLDPQNVPEEIMLQWNEAYVGWKGRAYWGANKIGLGTDGTNERRYMGPLPPAGQWVRLEVPASDVGMEGITMDAMAFTLYGGRANWDNAGVEGEYIKYGDIICDEYGNCYQDYEIINENKSLVDDSVPAGSNVGGDGGDGWNWTGAKTPQMLHQHFFHSATQTLQVNPGDKLYTWVYLDPANIPSEVMLQWHEPGVGWEHKAYWGANLIGWGADGTDSRRYIGPLPQVGNWVKLEIPASAVGLEGKTVNGMAFTLWGGQAAWDQAGKVTKIITPPVATGSPNYNESNNRIITAGYSYDAAGNLITEPNGKSYTYDGENRIIAATVGGATSQYTYDGNGRRVMKTVGTSVTRFEYSAGGELIAEYNNDSDGLLIKEYISAGQLQVTVENGSDYKYATSDHLGTPRVWTDKNGNVIAGGRHDYLPFGEEVFAGTGTRVEPQGYARVTQADGQRKQFTSKERDVETGLDYFGARYYSSTQGRFVSPDEFSGGPVELFVLGSGDPEKQALPYADIRNPQSLNKYHYTYNNPLKYIDPNGHCSVPAGLKPGSTGICIEAFIAAPRIGVIGLGDNRKFSGDDPNLTARVRIDILVSDNSVTQTTTTARSHINYPIGNVDGDYSAGIGLKGESVTQISNTKTDKSGTTTFDISSTGKNGIQAVPFIGKYAPAGTIDLKLNIQVSASGQVKLGDSSSTKLYPSYAMYSYRVDAKGNVTTTKLFELSEKKPEDLTGNQVRIKER